MKTYVFILSFRMRAHIADARLVLKLFFGSRRKGVLIFGVVFYVLQSNKIHGLDVISACGLTTRIMTMAITKKKKICDPHRS